MIDKRSIVSGLFAGLVLIAPAAWAGTTAPMVLAQAQTPAAGANSFTEGEAKSRIEKAGYTSVGALKQDDKGVWRGMASKDGKQMPVGLDFKGNVVTQ